MDIERRKLLKQQAKTQAAEEAAAMAQREADRDEALWTLIRDHLTRATPEQRHMYVASSNYDDNERGIRFLADLPDLAQGTAVMLFWLKGADALARLTPTEMASYQEDAWELIKLIEQRVVNGFYRTGTIRFDPANCPLYPGEYASLGPLVHPIAPQMYAITEGDTYVNVEVIREKYDEGLPEDVAAAVWAQWND